MGWTALTTCSRSPALCERGGWRPRRRKKATRIAPSGGWRAPTGARCRGRAAPRSPPTRSTSRACRARPRLAQPRAEARAPQLRSVCERTRSGRLVGCAIRRLGGRGSTSGGVARPTRRAGGGRRGVVLQLRQRLRSSPLLLSLLVPPHEPRRTAARLSVRGPVLLTRLLRGGAPTQLFGRPHRAARSVSPRRRMRSTT